MTKRLGLFSRPQLFSALEASALCSWNAEPRVNTFFFYLMALGGEDMAFIAVSTKHKEEVQCAPDVWGENRERYHQVCGAQETEC